MLRPTTKPSARIAERAQQAASRDPSTARLRLRFAVRDDFSEAARITDLANRRIDELLGYLDALRGNELIEMIVDMRGERGMLVQLVRDLHLELVRETKPGSLDEDEQDWDPDRDDKRRAQLLEAAEKVQKTHLFRSEQRLRGEEVTLL